MSDITKTCVRCKNPFVWTQKEQVSYKVMSFKAPKRCQDCRRFMRTQRQRPMRRAGGANDTRTTEGN